MFLSVKVHVFYKCPVRIFCFGGFLLQIGPNISKAVAVHSEKFLLIFH
jgi:hypothetical protein